MLDGEKSIIHINLFFVPHLDTFTENHLLQSLKNVT